MKRVNLKGKEAKKAWGELSALYSGVLDNAVAVNLICQYCRYAQIYADAEAEYQKYQEQTGRTTVEGANGVPFPHPSIASMEKAAKEQRHTITALQKLKVNKPTKGKDFMSEDE